MARLLCSRLSRSYPWFTSYLIASIAQTFILFLGDPGTSHSYLMGWMSTMPAILALRIGTVAELWHRAAAQYDGIKRASAGIAWGCIVVAIAISAIGGNDSLNFGNKSLHRAAYYVLTLTVRYSSSALAILSALAAGMLTFVPHGVANNVRRHAWILTSYFFLQGTSMYLMEVFRGIAPWFGPLITGLAASAYVAWAVLMPPAGEIRGEIPAPSPLASDSVSDAEMVVARLTPFRHRRKRPAHDVECRLG